MTHSDTIDGMPRKADDASLSISTGTIIRAVLVLIFFYFLYFIKDIVLVILSAIVIASAVEPGTRWFAQRRIGRLPAVLAIYIGAAAILVSVFYFFLIPLISESAGLLQDLPAYSQTLSTAQTGVNIGSAPASNFLGDISNGFSLPAIIDSVNRTLAGFSSGFIGTIDVVFGGVVSFVLIVVLSFYLAVQEDGVGKFLRIVTPIQHERYVIDLWKRSKIKIGLWMQGQLLLSVIVTVLVFLGLMLLGVRNALLLSVLTGIFELIPLFGSFLAAAPAILVGFIDGGVTMALLVTGLYVIINQFESQLIYPLVVKKVVGVPPIISILAIVIGGKLAGFIGILISVPIAAVFMEFINDLEKSKEREKITE